MDIGTTSPRISVLVLTRNRLAVLRNCIASVLKQRFADFEIAVLDDASDECDTAAAAANEFTDSRIRSYHVDSCLGVAGGRNFLMERSRGKILVSIDDDAVFEGENALAEVWSILSRNSNTAALAFRVTNVVQGERHLNLPFSKSILRRDPSIADKQSQVSYFIGCGHAIRRDFIRKHGGYRPDMVFGEEELDLAFRIVESGHAIAYVPSIEVDHFPQPSVVGDCSRPRSAELFYHVRNRAYLAYRYLPWKYAVPYVGIWMLRYAIGALRDNTFAEFFRGACATPQFLQGVRREVLNRAALMYLTKHGGRLWY